jgi:hypothetical protein
MPEICTVVIPIKLESSASVDFIHKGLIVYYIFNIQQKNKIKGTWRRVFKSLPPNFVRGGRLWSYIYCEGTSGIDYFKILLRAVSELPLQDLTVTQQ